MAKEDRQRRNEEEGERRKGLQRKWRERPGAMKVVTGFVKSRELVEGEGESGEDGMEED